MNSLKPGQASAAPLLHFENVCKSFGGTLAVNRVSLEVEAGSVLALLGENGAGKSTLIKLLAGVHRLDSGRILFNGNPIETDADRRGIAFIHQDLGLVDSLSAAENIAFTCGFARRYGLIDWRQVRRKAREALSQGGVHRNGGNCGHVVVSRAEGGLLRMNGADYSTHLPKH